MKFVFELDNVMPRHVIIEAILTSLFNSVCPEKTALLYSIRDILWHPPISLLRRETCKFISFWRGKKRTWLESEFPERSMTSQSHINKQLRNTKKYLF